MLELLNFEWGDKTLLAASWTKHMTSKTIFQNPFILRKAGVANFADITKIVTMCIQKTFKDSKEFNIRNYVLKYNLYSYFIM